uniref:BTB domain-containing protein n=1 Tax=Ditylenchus dipsaci TaxID=166011 RepID=A0A915CLZ5_9BILA
MAQFKRTLVAEKKNVLPSNGLLAAYSSYFKTLFFGEISRKKSRRDRAERSGCFRISLPSKIHISSSLNDADINPNNVESLLRLADCYHVKAVSHRCSEYLKKCAISEVSLGAEVAARTKLSSFGTAGALYQARMQNGW